MVNTWPTSRRVSQQSLGDIAQRTTNVHRHGLVNSKSWRVQQHALLPFVNEPSGRESIRIDDPGWIGDDDGQWAVLEYGSCKAHIERGYGICRLIDAEGEFPLTYG